MPLRTNESRCTDAFPHFPMIRRKSRLGIKATYHPVPDPDLEIGGGGGVSALRASVWSETEGGASPSFATAIFMAQPEFRMEDQIVRDILFEKLQKDYANYEKMTKTKLIPICTRRTCRLSEKLMAFQL